MAERIAYNLGNLWRRLALPTAIGNWSLTSLQQRLAKAGGRLVKHARYYWLPLAESHLTRRLFAACCGKSRPCRCQQGSRNIGNFKFERRQNGERAGVFGNRQRVTRIGFSA